MTTTAHPELEGLDRYKFGWADPDVAGEFARLLSHARTHRTCPSPLRQRPRRGVRAPGGA